MKQNLQNNQTTYICTQINCCCCFSVDVFVLLSEVIFTMASEYHWYKFYACMPLSVWCDKTHFLRRCRRPILAFYSITHPLSAPIHISNFRLPHWNTTQSLCTSIRIVFFFFSFDTQQKESLQFYPISKNSLAKYYKIGILFSWVNKNVFFCLDGVWAVMETA